MTDDNPRSIPVNDQQWQQLLETLEQDYSFRVAHVPMLRRRELGFDFREHHAWSQQRGSFTTRYLDFYQAEFKTLFLLRYGHIVS